MKTALLALLLTAVRKGDVESVKKFLDEDAALVDAHTEEGVHFARVAAYYRHPEIAHIFVRRGATLDVYDAATLGELSRVRQLVESNAGLVNSYSTDRATPLGLAAFFGHGDVVKYLIERKADPNVIAKNPAFPFAALHSAMSAGHRDIVLYLLEHGSNVNVREGGGMTVLHEAAGLGNREYVELLLKHGADSAARTDEGKTPSDYARQYKHADIAEYLDSVRR